MTYIKPLFTLLILFLGVSSPSAQESGGRLPPHIRTTGEATVTARPDRAMIDVGVVTQADTSQAAVTQNAQKLEATLARLRQLLGAGADIKAISYSVTPNYQYPREGGQPTIAGYTANNIVRVTLDDLTKVGSVIDTATQGGANQIQNLRFTLKDESPVKAQALREAAMKARAEAQALAAALNLTIVRVHSVVGAGSPVIQPRDVAFAKAQGASTPIDPGTIEISATVSLTVEVNQ
jgi:uncharacterized protein YggE